MKFDLDEDGMEPSKRSSFDGQDCAWLGENPPKPSRVGLISLIDDDQGKTILRAKTMMLIAMITVSMVMTSKTMNLGPLH